jgi:hypothetical protein
VVPDRGEPEQQQNLEYVSRRLLSIPADHKESRRDDEHVDKIHPGVLFLVCAIRMIQENDRTCS